MLLILSLVVYTAECRLMATLPIGAVQGIHEPLSVLEDLTDPTSPIEFIGPTTQWRITKSGEPITPQNQTALYGGRTPEQVMGAESDLLGNEILSHGTDPNYSAVADLLPPVLATVIGCADFAFGSQSFIGSRIAAEKRSFSATGEDSWTNTRQAYHFDQSKLTVNNTKAG